MRLEMTRTFPVPLERGWEYVEDFRTWSEWMNMGVVDPEGAAWEQPGDTIKMAGSMLGIKFPGSLVLEEKVALELSRTLYRWGGWPDIHVEQRYEAAGPGAFTLHIAAWVDEDAGLFGRSLMWLATTLPVLMQREVRHDLDRLEAIFRKDTAKPVKGHGESHAGGKAA
jgi:hypothetical protein